MADVQTSEVNEKLAPFNVDKCCMLTYIQEDENLKRPLFLNKKEDHGRRLKVKINILIYGDNS
jgi:hypothetical protein